MTTIDDPAPRRDAFTEGRSFVDRLGFTWHLPRLGPGSYDEIRAIRDLVRRGITGTEDGDIVAGEVPPIDQFHNMHNIICELLLRTTTSISRR